MITFFLFNSLVFALQPYFLYAFSGSSKSQVTKEHVSKAQTLPKISSLSDCNQFGGWSLKRVPKLKHSLVELKKGEFNGDDFCSARFELRDNEPQINDGHRSELSDPYIPEVGSRMSYRFSSYIPSQSLMGLSQLVIAQWHDNKPTGVPAQRPPLSIRIRNDKLVVPIWNSQIHKELGQSGDGHWILEMDIPTDRWVQFEIEVNWKQDHRGYVRLHIDNRLAAVYNGPIGYESDITAPYFKIGAYTTRKFKDTQIVILHTNYSRQLLGEKIE